MAADRGCHPPRSDRTEHEELAMGNIHHAHDAEHNTKAHRRQRQDGGGYGAFKRGKKEVRAEIHYGPIFPGAASERLGRIVNLVRIECVLDRSRMDQIKPAIHSLRNVLVTKHLVRLAIKQFVALGVIV